MAETIKQVVGAYNIITSNEKRTIVSETDMRLLVEYSRTLRTIVSQAGSDTKTISILSDTVELILVIDDKKLGYGASDTKTIPLPMIDEDVLNIAIDFYRFYDTVKNEPKEAHPENSRFPFQLKWFSLYEQYSRLGKTHLETCDILRVIQRQSMILQFKELTEIVIRSICNTICIVDTPSPEWEYLNLPPKCVRRMEREARERMENGGKNIANIRM